MIVACGGEGTLIWARGRECGTLEAMRIVVCVKHVPDMQSERRFEDGRLVRGEDDVLNELDENAIEAAVQLKEAEENADREGEVIALTMGPEDAEDALMRALQMGADRTRARSSRLRRRARRPS